MNDVKFIYDAWDSIMIYSSGCACTVKVVGQPDEVYASLCVIIKPPE